MSSSPIPKLPFLAAAALFWLLAGFIARVAIRPLGAADLLGMGACVAAGAAFATIPFVVDFTRRLEAGRHRDPAAGQQPAAPVPQPAPQLSAEALAAHIAAAVDARLTAALPAWTGQLAAALASADEKRREEILKAVAATPARQIDTDAVSVPAGTKARLGRGLLGLMHAPGAITPPAPEPTDDRAAA